MNGPQRQGVPVVVGWRAARLCEVRSRGPKESGPMIAGVHVGVSASQPAAGGGELARRRGKPIKGLASWPRKRLGRLIRSAGAGRRFRR